jgi:hypothetical protein
MIVTIAGTAMAGVTTIITKLRRNTRIRTINADSERGSLAAPPLSLFYCVASEAR